MGQRQVDCPATIEKSETPIPNVPFVRSTVIGETTARDCKIENGDPDFAINRFQTFLEKAIETKSIKTGKHVDKLHPEVVIELEKLL